MWKLIGSPTVGSKDKDETLLKRKLSALAVSSNPVEIVKPFQRNVIGDVTELISHSLEVF